MAQIEVVQRLNGSRDRMIAPWSRSDLAAQALTKELRTLDRRLECIYVDPEAAKLPPSQRGMGVVPGRWHVVRRNDPKVPDAWFPIMGPNMEYLEPTSKVVEDMKKADLWRPGALQELKRNQARAEILRGSRLALAHEQLRDNAASAYREGARMKSVAGFRRNFTNWGLR
jgi:hypothetical protein